MKPEDFENKLRNQPLQPIPAEWRNQILRRARRSPSPPLTWWSAWLWPAPRVWAGLGIAWVVLILWNVSMHEGEGGTSQRPSASPGAIVNHYQQQLRAELLMPEEAEPEPVAPLKPRSQRAQGEASG